jgi:hypothetical protein
LIVCCNCIGIYASHVRCITNDANKNLSTKEVARLKKIIAQLNAGKRVEDTDLEEIQDDSGFKEKHDS